MLIWTNKRKGTLRPNQLPLFRNSQPSYPHCFIGKHSHLRPPPSPHCNGGYTGFGLSGYYRHKRLLFLGSISWQNNLVSQTLQESSHRAKLNHKRTEPPSLTQAKSSLYPTGLPKLFCVQARGQTGFQELVPPWPLDRTLTRWFWSGRPH